MSFDRLPSKSEVMGWNPHILADYMKKMDLPGCDKVILRNSMSGSRFLNMSENDLQNFPKVHAPLISKICREINRKEEKRGIFGKRPTVPKYHQPETPSEGPGWDPDEFDTDDDYESPDDNVDRGSVGDYESPSEEIENEGGASDNDYEPPPSEPLEEMSLQMRAGLPMGNSHYIDNRNTSSRGQPPVPCPRPSTGPTLPTPTRPSLSEPPETQSREQSSQFPTKLLVHTAPPAPPVDRKKKPTTLERGLNHSPSQGQKLNKIDRLATPSWRPKAEEKVPGHLKIVKPPLPSSTVNRSNSSVTRTPSQNRFCPDTRHEVLDEGLNPKLFGSNTFPLKIQSRSMSPRPSLPGPAGLPGPPKHADSGSLPPSIAATGSLPSRLQEALNIHRSNSRVVTDRKHIPPPPAQASSTQYGQDMDTRWYMGLVKRGQAEGCLRQVNKDGAYLVRDSSTQSWEQPFTLMVLYQDKVYNIQIRRQENQYLLGTGLKAAETFPSVPDMIKHYSQSPLLLIDAKNRGLGQQNQCLLIYPAGY